MSQQADYGIDVLGPRKRLTQEALAEISDNYQLPLIIRLIAEVGVRLLELTDEMRSG